MARLSVEEGGERRAFRVGDGVLTIGSGAQAKLRLRSSDVAELHAELEVQGEGATLRARPGVLPPRIGGVAISGETRISPGQEIAIGSARIRLLGESAPSQGTASAGVPTGAGKRTVADLGQDKAIRRQRAMSEAQQREPRSVAQRTRPRVQRGLPGYAIGVLVVAGVGIVVLLGYQAFQVQADKGTSPVRATIWAAEKDVEDGNWERALARLGDIAPGQDVTDEERARIAALREEIRGRDAQKELDVANLVGTRYLDTKLAKYEKLYLQGNPDQAKVRVFLKRCRTFRERWPEHPGLEWVGRQESRFRGFVRLADPLTWADVEWECECLVRTAPRDYKGAFAILDGFLAGASGADLEAAQALREQMIEERKEYHLDRMQQARYEYQRDQRGAAVAWLVYAIAMIGDEEMENEAASYLIEIPEVEMNLRGYQSDQPDRFEELMRNAILRKFAQEKGIL